MNTRAEKLVLSHMLQMETKNQIQILFESILHMMKKRER